MSGNAVSLWTPPTGIVVPDTESNAVAIAGKARQLRERERTQVSDNLDAGNYEVATTFVWTRTMALLKKQLGSLGHEFIGELLQRPDFDEYTEISAAVSDGEAISLARDLGMLTALQTTRLLHSQAIVSHFAGMDGDPSDDESEVMTKEEAIACLRVCVQGVLGHERVTAAEDFKIFRARLSGETFGADAPEIQKLKSSPYFFVRTAVGILLTALRTENGAPLEHAGRNAQVIIPSLWEMLKAPERWQIGQTYAQQFSEGRRDSVRTLHAILVAVGGFDYVPENLRSNTFVQVASSVIAAHQGVNNFYHEAAPMKELASLGTSIPGPALAACFTAALCVKLGNFYGTAWAAQEYANQVIGGFSKDRWQFYLNERLPSDRLILAKLQEDRPASRWIELIQGVDLDPTTLTDQKVLALIKASKAGDKGRLSNISSDLLAAAIG